MSPLRIAPIPTMEILISDNDQNMSHSAEYAIKSFQVTPNSVITTTAATVLLVFNDVALEY